MMQILQNNKVAFFFFDEHILLKSEHNAIQYNPTHNKQLVSGDPSCSCGDKHFCCFPLRDGLFNNLYHTYHEFGCIHRYLRTAIHPYFHTYLLGYVIHTQICISINIYTHRDIYIIAKIDTHMLLRSINDISQKPSLSSPPIVVLSAQVATAMTATEWNGLTHFLLFSRRV